MLLPLVHDLVPCHGTLGRTIFGSNLNHNRLEFSIRVHSRFHVYPLTLAVYPYAISSVSKMHFARIHPSVSLPPSHQQMTVQPTIPLPSPTRQ
jgi:hypothetical protein